MAAAAALRTGSSPHRDDLQHQLAQIEVEAKARGPAAVGALRALDAHFAFAIELVTARRAAKMTQTRLAELSGIPQSEMSRFERGQGNPTLETIGKLLSSPDRQVASAPRAA